MPTRQKTRSTPRIHDPERHRAEILAAARLLFAELGYDRTTVRAIAAEAGVSHALVVTYFGGKEALFVEVVGRFEIPTRTLAGPRDEMGAAIAAAYVKRWEEMADDDPWLVMVRSSLSHPASNELLRKELHAQQTVPLREALGDDEEGRSRSAMVECLIAGMIYARYVYRVEPAASLPATAFEAAFARSLQHAITGPLPVDD